MSVYVWLHRALRLVIHCSICKMQILPKEKLSMRYETMPLPSKITNALPLNYIVGDYQITAVIADDPFSITYKANHTTLNLPVLIEEYLPKSMVLRNKSMTNVILKNLNDAQLYKTALTQYRQEANKLLKLHHPNIASVKTCIETNNTVYRVTDFINGHTLDYCIKEKLFSEKEITLLIKQLLHGLQAIHVAGFYHNDINPTNIIIKKDSLTPIIINLGQVKHLFRQHKIDIDSYISTGYSAHEQYKIHSKYSAQTDIYALGAVLYYLVSGITPHASIQRLSTTEEGKQDPLTPACLIAQGRYPKSILLAISHAMELQKTNRPQSLQDWKKELGIKKFSSFTKKVATTPIQKKLEIDFSVLTSQAPSISKKTKQQQYTRVLIITTAMLGVLVTGIANYKPLLNEVGNIEKTNKIKYVKKATATNISLQQVMIIATHRNLTTISTIIDSIYSHYPQRKLFSPIEESKSRNNIAVNLLPKFKKNNTLEKVSNENIHQTGRSNITKYKN